jgi:uncharacterized protein YjbJ (UPF0337 family)
MSSTEDRMKGKANELMGRGKQGLGEATGNREMKREGQAQEVKGDAQNLKGRVKDTVKRGVDDL